MTAGAPGAIRLHLNERPGSLCASDLGLGGLDAVELNRYPGREAIEEVISLLASQLNVDAGSLCLGNGADDLLSRFTSLFRGRRVVVLTPGYPWHGTFAARAGCEVHSIALNEAFDLDDSVVARVTEREPDLVIVSYPNNPTGNCFSRVHIVQLLDRLPRAFFLFDEVYWSFSGNTCLDLWRTSCWRLGFVRSCSKSMGLAGVRLGYLIADEAVIRAVRAAELPFHFSSLFLHIARTRFRAPLSTDVDDVVEERARVMEGLRSLGLKVYRSDANFVWCRVGDRCPSLVRALEGAGILLKHYPEYPEHVRVTVGTPAENQRLLNAMSRGLGRSCPRPGGAGLRSAFP